MKYTISKEESGYVIKVNDCPILRFNEGRLERIALEETIAERLEIKLNKYGEIALDDEHTLERS